MKGPKNTDLERQDLDKIFNAFERAQIPPETIINSIAQIVAHDSLAWSQLRRRRRIRANPAPGEISLPDLT